MGVYFYRQVGRTVTSLCAARELGEHGIRVNTLAPGFTLSDTVVAENSHHVETASKAALAGRAIRRDEHPQDLLGALVFLAGADSDFITGQTIAVDGGNRSAPPRGHMATLPTVDAVVSQWRCGIYQGLRHRRAVYGYAAVAIVARHFACGVSERLRWPLPRAVSTERRFAAASRGTTA
jgi:Enoyl-(Acyl carrier protein) reductase